MIENWFESEEEREWTKKQISTFVCATNLINTLQHLTAEPISEFQPDNIANSFFFVCAECGERQQDEEAPTCGSCGEQSEWDYHDVEVLEWWIVDEWMANQLEEIGQPVLSACCLHFWGRTCSGQVIELDGTIQQVYKAINKEQR